MKAKLLFGTGLAAGYVLGSRSGRAAYEKLKARAAGLWESQPVQDKVAAAAYDYMHLFGLVMLGHFWLRIVRAASRSAQPGAVSKAREKAMLADYFMRCILPETQVRLVRLTSGAECLPAATQGSWML